jgi:hypothetical protein
MEHLVEWILVGETEVLGGSLPQWYFVHWKSHMTWPWIEPEPPPWEAGTDDFRIHVCIINSESKLAWGSDPWKECSCFYIFMLWYIQVAQGGNVSILGDYSIDHSKQKKSEYIRVSSSERFPRYSYFIVQFQSCWYCGVFIPCKNCWATERAVVK